MMYHVCIEDHQVISILNYEPHVPPTVKVVCISDAEYAQIQAHTHYFDVSLLSVQPQPDHVMESRATHHHSQACLRFLKETDWKVLRHIRQLHLGEPTSLTADEYTQLEQERSRVSGLIQSD